jgi:hypothetical protein
MAISPNGESENNEGSVFVCIFIVAFFICNLGQELSSSPLPPICCAIKHHDMEMAGLTVVVVLLPITHTFTLLEILSFHDIRTSDGSLPCD